MEVNVIIRLMDLLAAYSFQLRAVSALASSNQCVKSMRGSH